MRVIIAALAAVCFVSPAFASHHPEDQPPAFIDAAAVAPYPAEQIHRVYRHHVARERHQAKHHEHAYSAPKSAATVVARVKASNAGASPPDWEDGIATPHPIIVSKRRPNRLEGILRIADATFDFVSGGIGASIPYGDYEISANSEGDWGARHGALDLTGNDRGEIWDPQLGRHREGIELHGGGYATEGCVAIKQWEKAKRIVLSMIHTARHAFLHVYPGAVSITPTRSSGQVIVALHQSIAKDRVARAERRPHRQGRYARHRYRHYAHA